MSTLVIVVLLAVWTAAALAAALVLGAVIARRDRQRPRRSHAPAVSRGTDDSHGDAVARGSDGPRRGAVSRRVAVRRDDACPTAGVRQVRRRRNHRS